MLKETNIISKLHLSTKRNYIERMFNKKVECMGEAKKYSKNYWDGPRKFGYGGYKYIPGRWTPVAKKLISKYKLNDKKVAIEHNGVIISKINYKKKCLKNNDKVEIVHFIGGG